MDPNLSAWLTRIGLLLDFLAFWFVFPEILNVLAKLRSKLTTLAALVQDGEKTDSLMMRFFLLAFALYFLISILRGNWQLKHILEHGAMAYGWSLLFILLLVLAAFLSNLVLGILNWLSITPGTRKRLAWCGALLFVVGIALQVAGTL